MNRARAGVLPLGRSDGLVVKEVAGETLVYDLESHKAHCLNPAAALVWKQCDGKTPIADLERMLQTKFGFSEAVDVAGVALRQLEKAKLITAVEPAATCPGAMTRREMLKALGCVAASLPLVTSIVAPTPAQAATLLGTGSSCTDGIQCTSGFCVGGLCT